MNSRAGSPWRIYARRPAAGVSWYCPPVAALPYCDAEEVVSQPHASRAHLETDRRIFHRLRNVDSAE